MSKPHAIAVLSLVLALSSGLTSAQTPRPFQKAHAMAVDVRRSARNLIDAWVETATPDTLDALALRTCAFAGRVGGLSVVVDGKPLDASTALVDSGASILGKNDVGADARAIRNAVAILTEIAEGRAHRTAPHGKRPAP